MLPAGSEDMTRIPWLAVPPFRNEVGISEDAARDQDALDGAMEQPLRSTAPAGPACSGAPRHRRLATGCAGCDRCDAWMAGCWNKGFRAPAGGADRSDRPGRARHLARDRMRRRVTRDRLAETNGARRDNGCRDGQRGPGRTHRHPAIFDRPPTLRFRGQLGPGRTGGRTRLAPRGHRGGAELDLLVRAAAPARHSATQDRELGHRFNRAAAQTVEKAHVERLQALLDRFLDESKPGTSATAAAGQPGRHSYFLLG